MKKSKSWFQSNVRACGVCLLSAYTYAASSAGDLTLTKNLVGPAGGVALQGGGSSMNCAWGESVAGNSLSDPKGVIESGYFGGRFGSGQNFNVVSAQIGDAQPYFQNGLQIGVTVRAAVHVTFSDEVDTATLPGSI